MSYLGALSAALALLSGCGAASYSTASSAPLGPGNAAVIRLLKAGETQTFPAGALRPGEVFYCKLDGGQTVRIRVPNHPNAGWSIGKFVATPAGSTEGAGLRSNRDGSVTATCGHG